LKAISNRARKVLAARTIGFSSAVLAGRLAVGMTAKTSAAQGLPVRRRAMAHVVTDRVANAGSTASVAVDHAARGPIEIAPSVVPKRTRTTTKKKTLKTTKPQSQKRPSKLSR